MTRPVLVTGASGFLGREAAAELVRRGHAVVGTSRDGGHLPAGVAARALALDDGGAAAAALVEALRPAAVLHLAARADADEAARDPAGARAVNAAAAGALSRAAAAVGAHLVLASTDLVFDGTRAPYAEDDPPAPLGPYMASKVEAEAAVRAASPSFLVARLALLYGPSAGRRPSSTDGLVARLRRGEPAPLFVDQVRTPLLASDAAALLADLLERRAAGVVHVAGPDRVSRHALGVAIARALGLDPGLCRPARAADAGLAPRPADASLAIGRLVGLVGRVPLGVAAGCARLAVEAAAASPLAPGSRGGINEPRAVDARRSEQT